MQWRKDMGGLDFSQFHDIWLEDFEGALQPMDEPYFQAKQIAPGTWQVLSAGDYTYVVEGDEEEMVMARAPGLPPVPGSRKTGIPRSEHPQSL